MKLSKAEKILIIILILFSVVLGTGLGIIISLFDNTSDIKELENFKPEVPSKIYDRNGNLISEIFTIKREPVTFDDLPKNLINSLIAIEDAKFYKHKGIDIKRIFGALWANIKTGRKSQGASTITMQLARTLFTGREKTWARKIKEAWLALKIEKKYSKNEILTLYFNQIYFGHGAYGVEAASQFYFNKHVKDLTLAECALLAGLPQSPNRLSPFRNPELARRRQLLVLEAMVKHHMVSSEDAYNSFQDFWVNFRLQMRSPSQSVFRMAENKAPHFVEYVRQKLEKLYGAKRIYTDGLKVYTSLDLRQQELAEKYLKEGLERQNEIYKGIMERVKQTLDNKILDSLDMISILFDLNINIGSSKTEQRVLEFLNSEILAPVDMLSLFFDLNHVGRIVESSLSNVTETGKFQKVEGALIAIEPKTGYITAMVGGSTFSQDNQLNRAVQAYRQVGSGFKPYIYTTAIDTKIFTPASIIVDSPVVFYDDDEEWIPSNYSGVYHGKVRLREALRKSINVVTAKVVDRLGIETVIKYASRILGITDPEDVKKRFPKVHSIALGVVELSPYEQARGFATFANEGKRVDPIAILYVLDRNGNLIDNFEAKLREKQLKENLQVVNPATNFIVVDMLRDVLRPGGTGYSAAKANGFDRPAAGKTGTTQNWKDAWFTGFTPDLVTCVWVGFDRNSVSLGRGQAGGVVAAPIWAKFMRDALKDKPATWYSKPKNVYAVKICKVSGLLPTKYCKDTMVEYFLEGTIPKEYCTECLDKTSKELFNIEIFKKIQPKKEEPKKKTLFPIPKENIEGNKKDDKEEGVLTPQDKFLDKAPEANSYEQIFPTGEKFSIGTSQETQKTPGDTGTETTQQPSSKQEIYQDNTTIENNSTENNSLTEEKSFPKLESESGNIEAPTKQKTIEPITNTEEDIPLELEPRSGDIQIPNEKKKIEPDVNQEP